MVSQALLGLWSEWGGGTHVSHYLIEAEWRIYVSVNYTIIGSDNGLSPGWRQAIIWAIVNWTLRNKLQWIFYRNWFIFIDKFALESVVSQNDGHLVPASMYYDDVFSLLRYKTIKLFKIKIPFLVPADIGMPSVYGCECVIFSTNALLFMY